MTDSQTEITRNDVPRMGHGPDVCPVLACFGAQLVSAAQWQALPLTHASIARSLSGTRATLDVEKRRAAFLIERVLRRHLTFALMVAVMTVEGHCRDATGLRAAGLALCDAPCKASAQRAARATLAAIDEVLDAPTHVRAPVRVARLAAVAASRNAVVLDSTLALAATAGHLAATIGHQIRHFDTLAEGVCSLALADLRDAIAIT